MAISEGTERREDERRKRRKQENGRSRTGGAVMGGAEERHESCGYPLTLLPAHPLEWAGHIYLPLW